MSIAAEGTSSRRRLVLVAVGWLSWAIAVACVLLFVVYPHEHGVWEIVATQVAGYGVLVAPVVVLRPPIQDSSSRTRLVVCLAVGATALPPRWA
ncbi:MAG: hypothetical protein ACYDEN_04150 [Acidimicrobiales bacterium]